MRENEKGREKGRDDESEKLRVIETDGGEREIVRERMREKE